MTFYEIVSGAIALAALVLSLYSAISTYREKHIKTNLFVRWIHQVSTQLNVSLLISNMSSRPATLTQIFLKYNDNTDESSWHHAKLLSREMEKKEVFCWSDVTPINIPARSSVNPVISFQHLSNFKLTDKITLIYVVDGVEYEQTFSAKHVLSHQEFIIALDYKFKNK